MDKHPNYDRAYGEGVAAREAGELASSNPYPEGHDEHDFFLLGFNNEPEAADEEDEDNNDED